MSNHLKTETWGCIACKFVLGYVEDKKIIRIKRKDLYVQVELVGGGSVTEVCPRCGKFNTIHDEPDEIVNLTEKGGN